MSATPGGVQPGQPPVCQNCQTSTTPLWRRDELGSVLCNACGLFLKLHGRPRPISLKTDVIKSRNRVKIAAGGARKKLNGDAPEQHQSLPAAHPQTASLDPSLRKPSHAALSVSERSNSPISRIGTPSTGTAVGHSLNIAPQHMFDSVTLDGSFGTSPSLPQFSFRGASPSASSLNGAASTLETAGIYDHSATALKTRVSELEVINDLFRGRVAELEASEQEARRAEAAAREAEARIKAQLDEVAARERELKRRLEQLEAENGGGPRKKMRLEDLVEDGRAGTPLAD